MKAKLILLAFLLSSFSSCHAIIKVTNVNGKPASNPHLGFGSYSDDNFFYFFESNQERKDFIAQLNVGVKTPEEYEAEDLIIFNHIKNYLQANVVGKKLENLTATDKDYILAGLLYRVGGVDKDRKVNPLNQWLKK